MKSCKEGHYYCYTESKCKKIPAGYRVGMGGYLRKEREDEKQEIDEKFRRQYKDKKKLSQSSQRKSTGRGSSIKPGSKKSSYESKKEHRETSKKLAPYQTKGTYNAHVEENVEIQNSDGQTTALVIDIVGPAHMKPVINSSGVWKGTQQIDENLFKFAKQIISRGSKDTKLTKDIISIAKKLRNPDGVAITKIPRIDTSSKSGGLAKTFKGFMQRVKDTGSNLVNRTKGKLNRTDIKTNTPVKPSKVDVLGGAATNPATPVKPMKNITPTPIGDGIAKVANKVKTGATTAAVTGGVVAGSKLTSSSPSKIATPTPLPVEKKVEKPPVEKKVEAPITNDGKKEINPSKNEKISRRDARVKSKTGVKGAGKGTRWVGTNTTWIDRHGNVIAPRVKNKPKRGVLTPLEQEMSEGAYKDGGIIINPSGSRNQWGIPPVKSLPGGIKDIPLTPTQVRMMQAKTVNAKKGLKTQLAHYDLKGDQIDEFIGGRPGDGYIGHPNLDIKNPLAKKQVKKKVMPNSKGGGLLNTTAGRIGDRNMELNKLLNQSFDPIDENVAVRTLRTGNTFRKALGAVLAAKGGEKILKDLLGTPDKPKDTDWVNNPKDRTDDELNVRSNQVKDAEKHKDFDTDMKALRRGKNLSPEEKVQRLKDAKEKRVQEQTQEPPNLSGIRDIISGVANKNMDTLIKSPSLQNLKKSAEQIVGTGKNEGAPGTLSGIAKTLGPKIKKDLQKTGMDMFKDIYKQVGTKYNLNQHYNMQEQEKLPPSQKNLSTLDARKKIQQSFDDRPLFIPKTTTKTENGKTTTSATMVSREAETKRQLSKVGPIRGVKVELDPDGHVPNAGKFAADISTQELKKVKPNSNISKSDLNTAKKYASGGELERAVNSANPGSSQFRANIAADEINKSTQKFKSIKK